MPRVSPGVVVAIIDAGFPSAAETSPTNAQVITLDHGTRSRLGGILNVFDQISTELLATAGLDEFARIMLAAGELRESVVSARTYVTLPGTPGGHPDLRPKGGNQQYNALSLLRQSLSKCHDQAPPESSTLLRYLTSPVVRDSILADVASVERCLNNGEWKAVTVVSGSVMEALLLWALRQRSPQVAALDSKPTGSPEDWKAKQLIAVARQLGLIEDATQKSCLLAKDVRDLIHPGAVLKNPFPCDQATAFVAIAAVYSTIRDIERQFA